MERIYALGLILFTSMVLVVAALSHDIELAKIAASYSNACEIIANPGE